MKKKEIRRKEDEFEIKCKHEAREREGENLSTCI